ncbi:MDR family MFS transporter [Sporolactobacillus inulinus]|uniref:Permeases of the major facilitator superfamily n=2 Tax=Sporolactobacillus inulinus TaxID=2078 RepID=A0A4Y1ZGW3_9BACL|nr:MDR family MFS transporter [Sporolactobacillus inulinus]KLI03461.1 multidrug transporter [Sporolactobacillus inulinus CASD]GAY78193.1 permeases of the major facilitator superfamily [Sporolactobacillus inulinus]GEB77421.1 multidrug transporter [Sporolactobacillus inulinus]
MTEKNQPTDIDGKAYNRTFLIVILLVGAFCTILNQTLLATALPDIMKDFDISAATGQWLTSGFLLMNGVMIPVTALLINKINSRVLYIGALILFLAGTVTAALAPNFSVLLVGRLIQAAGAGTMMPLMQTISLLIVPREKRGVIMGLGGLVIAFAPALGPTLSGWIVDRYDWRVLFEMMIPIVVVVIILAFAAMKKVVPLTNPRIDFLSLVLSTLGFGGVLYGFSSVGNYGWSDGRVVWPLVVGAVFTVFFVWRQLVAEEPMLELRVFKSPIFTLSVVISSIVMMAMIGAELVLPLYIQNIRGESALNSGLMLLPGAIIMGLMSPVTGIIFDRIGSRKLAITGMFLLTVGTLPFMFLTEHTSFTSIIVLYAVRFVGISMVMMPVTTAGMNALPDSLMSHGTAVNNTIRTVAGSIGTAILISILTNVTKNDSPSKQLMHTHPSQYGKQMLDAALNGMNAAFIVAICFCVLTLILTFFIKGKNKQAVEAQGAD